MALGDYAQTDPFAAMGGGVQLPNGQWVPKDHPLAQQFATGGTAPQAQPAPTTPDPFAAMGGGRQVNGDWVPNTMTDAQLNAPRPIDPGAGAATPPQPSQAPDVSTAQGGIEQPEAVPGYGGGGSTTPAGDLATPVSSSNAPQGWAGRAAEQGGISGPRGNWGQFDPNNWANGQVPDYWKQKQGTLGDVMGPSIAPSAPSPWSGQAQGTLGESMRRKPSGTMKFWGS